MSDTLKQIADNLGVTTINGNYLSGIADYYGVDLATSTDLMRDILTEVGGNPATSTDYLQDIVLELGGTVTINGNWMEAWQAITSGPPAAPVNTVAPVISGGNYVGDVLTTTDGTWTGSPTFTYQWFNENDTENIVGATSSTYTLGSVLAGIDISCKVTGTNAAGSDTGVSNVIGTLPLSAPVNVDPPAILSDVTWLVGMTIYFSYNYWYSNPPNPTLTYQWQRDGVNISGETNTTYLLDYADEGYLVGVKCTATNSEGSAFVLSNTVLIEA